MKTMQRIKLFIFAIVALHMGFIASTSFDVFKATMKDTKGLTEPQIDRLAVLLDNLKGTLESLKVVDASDNLVDIAQDLYATGAADESKVGAYFQQVLVDTVQDKFFTDSTTLVARGASWAFWKDSNAVKYYRDYFMPFLTRTPVVEQSGQEDLKSFIANITSFAQTDSRSFRNVISNIKTLLKANEIGKLEAITKMQVLLDSTIRSFAYFLDGRKGWLGKESSWYKRYPLQIYHQLSTPTSKAFVEIVSLDLRDLDRAAFDGYFGIQNNKKLKGLSGIEKDLKKYLGVGFDGGQIKGISDELRSNAIRWTITRHKKKIIAVLIGAGMIYQLYKNSEELKKAKGAGWWSYAKTIGRISLIETPKAFGRGIYGAGEGIRKWYNQPQSNVPWYKRFSRGSKVETPVSR